MRDPHTAPWLGINVDFRTQLRAPQQDDEIDISGEELRDILSCFNAYGRFSFDVGSGRMIWSEDVYRIHDMPVTPGRVALRTAMSRYHPQDRHFLAPLLADTIASRGGFQFALRVRCRRGSYKLVQAVGRYREHATMGAQIVGALCDRQPGMRMIGAVV